MARKNDEPQQSEVRLGEQANPNVPDEQPHPAAPVHEASDYAGDKEYRDMDDKPSPDTVAQVEIRSDERDK